MAEHKDKAAESKDSEKRSKKLSVKKEDGYEVLDAKGSVPVYRVDTEDENYGRSQDEALLAYKVTGVVGDFRDPLRDQEPDIAPEFGVSPQPELQNPPSPEGVPGSNDVTSILTRPLEEKVAADDPDTARGVGSGKAE